MKALFLIFLSFAMSTQVLADAGAPQPAPATTCHECGELENLETQFIYAKANHLDDSKVQYSIVMRMAKSFVRLTSLNGELDADQTKFVVSILKLVSDEGFRGELLDRNIPLFKQNHDAFAKILSSGSSDERQILRDIDSTLLAEKYAQSMPKPVIAELGPPPGQSATPASTPKTSQQ